MWKLTVHPLWKQPPLELGMVDVVAVQPIKHRPFPQASQRKNKEQLIQKYPKEFPKF